MKSHRCNFHNKVYAFLVTVIFVQLPFLLTLLLASSASGAQNNDVLQSFKNINFTNISAIDIMAREAIKHLHDDLDRDDDGNVSQTEGAQFIDHKDFDSHNSNLPGFATDKDGSITEAEFWETWLTSEVHNWTVMEMAEWLSIEVELPQYAEKFKQYAISGAAMPIFLDPELSALKKLGVTATGHKRKIHVRAMEIVIFGLPKPKSNLIKDVLLTVSIILALSGVTYAVHVRRSATLAVAAMHEKLNNLQKEMNKLDEEDSWSKDQTPEEYVDGALNCQDFTSSQSSLASEQLLQSRLNEVMDELSDARFMLERAEERLNDQKWLPPERLVLCLKATYKVETKLHESKRQQAQKKVEQAKGQFLKMKKKTSIFNSVQLVHSHQVDNFDLEVQSAKDLLSEVQKESQEYKRRWRELEVICKCRLASSGRPTPNVKHLPVAKDGLSSAKIKNPVNAVSPNKRGSDSDGTGGLQMKDVALNGGGKDNVSLSSMQSCPVMSHAHRESDNPSAASTYDVRLRTSSFNKAPTLSDRDRFSEHFRTLPIKSVSPLLSRPKADTGPSRMENVKSQSEGERLHKRRPSLEASDMAKLMEGQKFPSSRSLPDMIEDENKTSGSNLKRLPQRGATIDRGDVEKPNKKQSFFKSWKKKIIS